ncbi:hypothetical protein HYDPIDRAFT_38545 [Hydnomerulius pinastri MD-312]|nr:hypothetical protein HYDPIDRAFT_38545 [Hydnomerulius pinastri MD-312]
MAIHDSTPPGDSGYASRIFNAWIKERSLLRGHLDHRLHSQITMVSFKSALFALALAAEFYVFEDENCDYSGKYEELWGTDGLIDTQCHNLSENLPSVHSFAFTSDISGITMYPDRDCQGDYLGYSGGNWFDNSVSSAGSKMKSFMSSLIK